MEDVMTLLRNRKTAELIERIKADATLLDFRDDSGTSLLLLSAYYRNDELMQYIIDHKKSFTLYEAAACGLLEAVHEHVVQTPGRSIRLLRMDLRR
jgi:hypothetical protein